MYMHGYAYSQYDFPDGCVRQTDVSGPCALCKVILSLSHTHTHTHKHTHKNSTDSGAANQSIQDTFVGNMHDVDSEVFACKKLLYESWWKVALNPFDRNQMQPLGN
jgi:hypothetical protein